MISFKEVNKKVPIHVWNMCASIVKETLTSKQEKTPTTTNLGTESG